MLLASCLRPVGMHEEKAPQNLVLRMGYLKKCAEVINIFAYFLPYMVSEVGDHFGSSYKAFICMLSSNVHGRGIGIQIQLAWIWTEVYLYKVANEICLQGRGSKYYSFEQQIGHRKSNWFRPDEISSCVRLKELSNPQGIGAKCKYSCIMSQINCFFSIHCPQQFWGNGNNDENIMNKAHFVLCNSQRGKFHPRTNTMELRIDNIAEQIRNNLPILVSMNDVVLQQLVVLGLDAAGKPIYLGNDAEIYAKRNSVVNVNSSDVCKLIFFQMGKLCI